jgi:hypothetical protein
MTPQRPTFASSELQKAVDESRSVLEGVDEAMSRVSSDIKALEAYLQSLNLKHPYRYTLGKGFITESGQEHEVAISLDCTGGASGGIQEEALVWGPDKTGKSRLLYEVSHWQGSIDVDAPGGPLFWDEATLEREAKPLIETRFEIRKRMYVSHFPDFVRAMAKHLQIDQKPSDEGEIPF